MPGAELGTSLCFWGFIKRDVFEDKMRLDNALDGLETSGEAPLVLLFYDGYELKAMPGLLGALASQGHRLLRYMKRSLMKQQVRTGFYTAFLGMVKSLQAVGCRVRINDFAAARARPSYPIGVGGYSSVFEKIKPLPNPIIFGPGDPGLPPDAEKIAGDPRFRRIIQPSDWACDLYRPYYGDKMFTWFAGIDMADWPDYSGHPKALDFIVYDKIRWHRETQVPAILDRITGHLRAGGKSYTVLRYGHHHHSKFKNALRQAKALIFICEHETQGLAYQEALSANVPVLAWDEGEIVDPMLKPLVTPQMNISSVPYFSPQCGRRFKMADFHAEYAAFLRDLNTYQPRRYVAENLSLARAGQAYLEAYAALAKPEATISTASR